jgi:hypothetical protein
MDQTEGASRDPRLFTLDEANAVVPRVRELLLSIQEGASRLSALQQRLESFRERKRTGAHVVEGEGRIVSSVMGEANRVADDLRGLFADLHGIGCEVKDVQMGLVDFRALRDDRTVYLCWKLGEDDIRFWHELDTGFAGRQPL